VQPLEDIKTKIREALPELECVIGWEKSWTPLTATPLFMRAPEDVDRLIWGPFNVNNPATYLTGFKGKKIGILVKGCDSRSVVQLLQENLVKREDLTIFGLPCKGVLDVSKVVAKIGDPGMVKSAELNGDVLQVATNKGATDIPFSEVMADKCVACQYPNAIISDHFAGDPLPPSMKPDPAEEQLAALAALAPAELFEHWAGVMDKCIRCYACRNACPMCVCRDHCIAQSRDPHWISQEHTIRDKIMFQMIHALHLAGRCTECGECQRACPVDIPILALRKKLNRVVKETFDYQAGIDSKATPPLFTFQVEEANINERGW
jgi:formate dehydrogenase (coenzyme F420) beta subunit